MSTFSKVAILLCFYIKKKKLRVHSYKNFLYLIFFLSGQNFYKHYFTIVFEKYL